jgi:hypothetical protein
MGSKRNSFFKYYFSISFYLVLAVTSYAELQEAQRSDILKKEGFTEKSSKSMRKSPTWAMISSAFLPGGGQFYTENYKKGVLFALSQGTLIGMTLYEHIKTEESWDKFEISGDITDFNNYSNHYDRRRTLLFIDTGVWILSIADAYISAHFYDFDRFSFSPFPNPTLSAVVHF